MEEVEDRLSTIMIMRTALMTEVEALCIELEAVAASVGSVTVGSESSLVSPIVMLEKLRFPKFSGIPRDFG